MIIDEAEHLPDSGVYRQRFGSLVRAYKMVGFTPDVDYSFLEINKRLREMHPVEVRQVITTIEEMGGAVKKDRVNDLLTINEEFSASLVIARCQATAGGSSRWNVRFDTSLHPDITIVARMDADNDQIQDFYLLPTRDIQKKTCCWPRTTAPSGMLSGLTPWISFSPWPAGPRWSGGQHEKRVSR